MLSPSIPINEARRVQALRSLNVLDTPAEERFDRVTRLARRMFGVPIALVSLIDSRRQWFKSCNGLPVLETPRDISFCGHAILGDEVFVVENASEDERFSDNPLVTGAPDIRFYAGCPLEIEAGVRLGTLCIIDRDPRSFNLEDQAALRDLAEMIEQELAAVSMATMDALSGLSNRRGFEALAGHAVTSCRRFGHRAALVYFDLDLFKQINDTYGHAEGDKALVGFAEALRETFRESDVVGRLGGDEFAVFCSGATRDDVNQTLGRMQASVEAWNSAVQRGYQLQYSAGIVDFDCATHTDINTLMACADKVMYEQKELRRAARLAANARLTEQRATGA